MTALQEKYQKLEQNLSELHAVAVAFSGGVDSAFLLAVLAKIPGIKKLLAVSVASAFVPQKEIDLAGTIAAESRADYHCLEVDILSVPDVVCNTPQRCYHCKKVLFSAVRQAAEKQGIFTVLHGVNQDDLSDYRPGLKAADELGFLSPLAAAGLTKADIRELSRQMGLDTWNKLSQSCLATRIPFHTPVTAQNLKQVEQAESVLQNLGFDQVRVRWYGKMARVEVAPEMIEKFMTENMRQAVSRAFSRLGFVQTAIDIDGYKTGKMNHEILTGPTG